MVLNALLCQPQKQYWNAIKVLLQFLNRLLVALIRNESFVTNKEENECLDIILIDMNLNGSLYAYDSLWQWLHSSLSSYLAAEIANWR